MSAELRLFQGPTVNQQMGLAPQLLQWLKLLQSPTQELASLVQHELETNPALEVDADASELSDGDADDVQCSDDVDSFDVPETRTDEYPTDESSSDENSSDELDLHAKLESLTELDEEWREESRLERVRNASDVEVEEERHQYMMDGITSPETLQSHLERQIAMDVAEPRHQTLARLIVGSLDDRGYLTGTVSDLAAQAGLENAEAEAVLRRVQQMDPRGIAARDLRECLLSQLTGKAPVDTLARRILDEGFDLLSRRDFSGLADLLSCEEDDIHLAFKRILRLTPEPGRNFTATTAAYVTADVHITSTSSGELAVEVASNHIPRLRISASCRKLVEDGVTLPVSEANYIRRKIRSASFLIQGLSQRQETLRKVAAQIVQAQGAYINGTSDTLAPLTIQKVARIIGLHETTVSRALASKYAQTPRGMIEMRLFFSTGYTCADGSALTPDSVKTLISDLIEQEDARHPLTDLQIARVLKEQRGLKLARRTVAKYREELSLQSSKDRLWSAPFAKRTAAATASTVPPAIILPMHDMQLQAAVGS